MNETVVSTSGVVTVDDGVTRGVTVLVPSYNYRRYLREAVESAVHQDGVDVDVIIVDNASTDGSLQLAHELAGEHPNVQVVAFPDNGGIVCSFNRCLDQPRRQYSVILCADDRLTPGSLRRSVDALDANPGVGLVYGPVRQFDQETPAETDDTRQSSGNHALVYDGSSWIEGRCRDGRNSIRAPEAVWRTRLQRSVGQFDPALPHTFDLHLWLRLAAKADVAFLPGALQAMYRVHGENHSLSEFGGPLAELEQHWTAFDHFLTDLDGDPRVARWRQIVTRTIGRRARWSASRVFAQGDPATRRAESAALLDLSERCSGASLSSLEALSWGIQRRIGPKGMWAYPPFVGRLAFRAAKRRVTDLRRRRTGL